MLMKCIQRGAEDLATPIECCDACPCRGSLRAPSDEIFRKSADLPGRYGRGSKEVTREKAMAFVAPALARDVAALQQAGLKIISRALTSWL